MARYITTPDGKKHLVEEIKGSEKETTPNLVDEKSLRAKHQKQDNPVTSGAKTSAAGSKGE